MDRTKGIAYCGLACCVCSENTSCAGCRNDGCRDKEDCMPFNCCKSKGLNGCWECEDFPCDTPILGKTRVRAFARFAAAHGMDRLMDLLQINEDHGIVYHDPGLLTGDYDRLNCESDVVELLLLYSDGSK